jgi:hypothetical protein
VGPAGDDLTVFGNTVSGGCVACLFCARLGGGCIEKICNFQLLFADVARFRFRPPYPSFQAVRFLAASLVRPGRI